MLKQLGLALLITPWVTAQPLAELRSLFQQAANQSQGQSQERQAVGARCEILGVLDEALLRGQGDWNQFFQFYQVTQNQASQASLSGPMLSTWQQIERLMVDVGRSQGKTLGQTSPASGVPSGPLAQAAQQARALESQARRQGGGSGYNEALVALSRLRQDLEGQGNWQQSRRQFYLTRWGLGLSNQSFEAIDRWLDQL